MLFQTIERKFQKLTFLFQIHLKKKSKLCHRDLTIVRFKICLSVIISDAKTYSQEIDEDTYPRIIAVTSETDQQKLKV